MLIFSTYCGGNYIVNKFLGGTKMSKTVKFDAKSINEVLGTLYNGLDLNKKPQQQRNRLKNNLAEHLTKEGYDLTEEKAKSMRDLVNVWFDAKTSGADTLSAIKNHEFFKAQETAPATENSTADKKAENTEGTATTETPAKKTGSNGTKKGTTATGTKKPTTTTKTSGTKKKPASTSAKKKPTESTPSRPRTVSEIIDASSAETDSKKTKKSPSTPKKEEKAKKSFKLNIKPSAVAIICLSLALIGVIVFSLFNGGNLFPFSQNGPSNNGNATVVEKYENVKSSTLLIAASDGTKVQLDTACTQDMEFVIDGIAGKTPTVMDDGYGGEAEAIYFYGVDNSVLRITYPIGKSFSVDTLLSGATVVVKDGIATLKTSTNTYAFVPYVK